MRAVWISLLVLLAVTAGSGFARSLKHRSELQVVRLPDGSQIELGSVTFGEAHRFRFDNRPQDLFYPVLPRAWRQRLNSRVMTHTSLQPDTCVIWLRHTRSWPADNGGALNLPPFFLAAFDEYGLESDLLYSPHATRTRAAGERISAWELRHYPRRDAVCGVRVFFPSPDGRPVSGGEFKFRNPGRKAFPVWPTEALPAARGTNGLRVTIQKLETGVVRDTECATATYANARAITRARFTFTEQGRTTEDWSITSIGFANAAGEQRPDGIQSARWWHGEQQVDLPGALWANEPAWRCQVNVARTAGFSAETLWHIRGVLAPGEGQWVPLNLATNLLDTHIGVLGVRGPPPRKAEQLLSGRLWASVQVRVPHPLNGARLVLVGIRDESGQSATLRGSTSQGSTGGGGAAVKEMIHDFGFDVPRGATTLDLTFALTPVWTVGFVVKPTLPSTSAGLETAFQQ